MRCDKSHIEEGVKQRYSEFIKDYGMVKRTKNAFESSHIIVCHPGKDKCGPIECKDINAGDKDLSLYLHIPFCLSKCAYCHYISEGIDAKKLGVYVEDLKRDIEVCRDNFSIRDQSVKNIHIGGGTPTILKTRQMIDLLDAINESFNVEKKAEITVESCPSSLIDGLSNDNLSDIIDSGVNRLSVGVQSFHDPVLRIANRSHSGQHAINAVQMAYENGFHNLNIDMMIGLPGQNTEILHKDMEILSDLPNKSITLYIMRLKSSVPMYDLLMEHSGKFPSEEENLYLTHLFREYMSCMGYSEDPVNWFSKEGGEYMHQIDKWTGRTDVLALGVAGYSYLNGIQFYNVCDQEEYHQRIKKGITPVECGIILDEEQKKERYALFTMKTNNGADKKEYQTLYNSTIKKDFPKIHELIKKGLINESENNLSLTEKGRILPDETVKTIIEKSA